MKLKIIFQNLKILFVFSAFYLRLQTQEEDLGEAAAGDGLDRDRAVALIEANEGFGINFGGNGGLVDRPQLFG